MTRKEAKELLPIIQAFAEGKTIQFMDNTTGKWVDCYTPNFYEHIKYRIKPESKYRPFKNNKECWEEMKKHQPFGWIKYKSSRSYHIITGIYNGECEINEENNGAFNDVLTFYTFADGTPFGIKDE